MVGAEALSLQGLDFERQEFTGCTEPQKLDLAGNAFNGYVVAALFAALMSSVDWEAAFTAFASRAAQSPPGEGECDSCEEEEEGEESESEIEGSASEGDV